MISERGASIETVSEIRQFESGVWTTGIFASLIAESSTSDTVQLRNVVSLSYLQTVRIHLAIAQYQPASESDS